VSQELFLYHSILAPPFIHWQPDVSLGGSCDHQQQFFLERRYRVMLFYKKERGQGMVEYALIIVLIALVVLGALALFGEQLSTTYSDIVSNLDSVIN
jgi:pilus assembly protein Flp/PilA